VKRPQVSLKNLRICDSGGEGNDRGALTNPSALSRRGSADGKCRSQKKPTRLERKIAKGKEKGESLKR